MPLVRGGWYVDNSGVLQVTLSGGGVAFLNGANMKSDGTVLVAQEASQSRIYENGLPYDTSGNLIIDTSGAISVWENGFPFTSAGAIAASSNSADHIGPASLAVDSGGKLCVNGLFGPNLLTNPNGPYGNAPWTLDNVTETTGQADPLGGTTASLITDTALNARHRFYQSIIGMTVGVPYQITVYYKPGTYPNGFTVQSDASGVPGAAFLAPTTATVLSGSGTAAIAPSTNGFYKCTLVWTTSGANAFFMVEFGQTLVNPYVGSAQNQTFWGLALQSVG